MSVGGDRAWCFRGNLPVRWATAPRGTSKVSAAAKIASATVTRQRLCEARMQASHSLVCSKGSSCVIRYASRLSCLECPESGTHVCVKEVDARLAAAKARANHEADTLKARREDIAFAAIRKPNDGIRKIRRCLILGPGGASIVGAPRPDTSLIPIGLGDHSRFPTSRLRVSRTDEQPLPV